MKTTDWARSLFVLFILCALVVASGCSRNPAKSENRSESKRGTEQSDFPQVLSESSDTGQTLALAEAAYAAKDWEAAEKHYVSITRAIPKEATPWFRLGNIYARTDRPDFAVRAYKEALVRDSQMSKAWYNMGLVQLRQSANSFLQMRTYTPENSESQIRADTMYRATIGLIKDGPKRTRAFPYDAGGTVAAPAVRDLPAELPPGGVPELTNDMPSRSAETLPSNDDKDSTMPAGEDAAVPEMQDNSKHSTSNEASTVSEEALLEEIESDTQPAREVLDSAGGLDEAVE